MNAILVQISAAIQRTPFFPQGGLLRLAVALTSVALFCFSANATERKTLRGHVPPSVAEFSLPPEGRLDATHRLRLALGLQLRDTNGFQRLFQAVSDPSSPQFRRYLAPEQITARFGPAVEDYEAVKQFALQSGLEVTATFSHRMVLSVAGSVADIEKAFNIKLNLYQHPTERRLFYAPNVEPSVPAELPVVDISGLDNYSTPRAGWNPGAAVSPAAAGGSGPLGGLLAKDLRNAYVPGVALAGEGQAVGLVEFGSYSPSDVTRYEDLAGLPHVPLQHILLDGATATGTNGEADLDIDMAVAMAPGLAKVVVFDAGASYNLNDVVSSMVEYTNIRQFSASYIGFPLNETTDHLFQRMALQGQSCFQAAADGDSWNNDPVASIAVWPADDPYITSVGGTALTMMGDGAAYGSETVWNQGYLYKWYDSAGLGSGGGISLNYPIPVWQEGLSMSANDGSTTRRNYPDVAMAAEGLTVIYAGLTLAANAGTSFAAPLWAGLAALVNEKAAANGDPPVGFLNPALYALGESPNYTNCFHDITVGNNDASPVSPSLFPAVPGYDLCTGWGSPSGSNLIDALALLPRLQITPGSSLAFTNFAGGLVNPASLTLTLTNRTGSLVWVAGWNQSWLNVSPAYGTLLAGGPATVVTVTPNPDSLAAGSYGATLSFTNLTDQSVLTRPVNLAIVRPPMIAVQPSPVAVSEGMSASFSVETAANGALAYQWRYNNGVSTIMLADGAGVSGSSTSALTISNISLENAGSYSVTVSNASGIANSAEALLTVLTRQAPIILSSPSNQTARPGATASFMVAAAGDQPLSYVWQFNGASLANGNGVSGAGSSALTVAAVTAAAAGSYSVIITNSFGSVTSSAAFLNVPTVAGSGAALQTIYSFNTNSVGVYPFAGLFQAGDGNLYGSTSGGGAEWGAIYRCTTNGIVSKVYDFTGGNDGGAPYAGLIEGSNGMLYGTSTSGGSLGAGTVFATTISGKISSFSLNSATTGANIIAGLVQGRDGSFYGTAYEEGSNATPLVPLYFLGNGTIFKMSSSGVLTDLATFNGENGSHPGSTLVQGSDGDFYGTTHDGGINGGFGTIFKVSFNGTIATLHSFANPDGAGPYAGLTQDADGSFYGTTYTGGSSNAGTVFRLGADGAFTSLYSFTGGEDGSNCYGGLLLAADGNFYGTTEGGGLYGLGSVFRISRNGILTPVVSFDGEEGAVPEATLIQATDGNLYGATQFGGAYDFGAIFRISLEGPLQITEQPQSQEVFAGAKAVFSVATSGNLPLSYQWLSNGVSLADGGNVSGSGTRILILTNVSSDDAAAYSVTVRNSYNQVTSGIALLQINNAAPSLVSQPQSQTVLAGATVTLSAQACGNSPLYFQWRQNGINLSDGGNISGSVTPALSLGSVAISNSGAYSLVISNSLGSLTSAPAMLPVLPVTAPGVGFSAFGSFIGGANPFNPYAGVIQAADGNFYGTTLSGGSDDFGSVFELPSSGALPLILHSFTNGVDGAAPFAGLVQASDGNFYGAAFQSIGAPFGALFKVTATGAFVPLYSFAGASDGGNPIASLIQARDGNLYGAASIGGSNGFGAIFSLNTNGAVAPVWSFQSSDGSFPAGPLLQGADGRLYGTTALGGSNNLGTIFCLGPGGQLSSLASFDYTCGAYPSNGLIQTADGSFYGTASGGGTNGGWGTVFRLGPDGALTVLHSFNYEDGAVPVGGLAQGADGNLYGTTSQGGVGGHGAVFQLTTNGALTTLLWFNGFNGANPRATLIQAGDGSLYGTAEFGARQYNGANESGEGLIFKITMASPPRLILSASLSQSRNLVLSWSGGQAPYQVQMASDLANPNWQNLGGPVGSNNLTLPATNAAEFYRIREN